MSARSRCDRAKIGAVVVSRDERVVATGYNGPPATYEPPEGLTNRCRDWCLRYRINATSGRLGLPSPDPTYSDCPSNHAEINALLHCSRQEREGGSIYVTGSVCMACAKAIANSGLARVFLVNVDREADAHRNPDKVEEFLFLCGLDVYYRDL